VSQSQPMPAIFLGHGNPMNAIQHNAYTQAWAVIGRSLPRPKAILSISAHWYVPGTWVTAMEAPRTIHDFGGFSRDLFQVKYPAPGSPWLAGRVQRLLAPIAVHEDGDWGLDHGTWSVLCHAYPRADIPVVQLSIDATQPIGFHHQLAKGLAPLRDEEVLVVGSGNVVHNLALYAWGRTVPPFDWAARFETAARHMIEAGEIGSLLDYETLDHEARLAVPTLDHYLPLLYVLALRREGEPVSFPVDGIEGGSISMLGVRLG
jgi:4,5-DOPA dioxygenase extradiol